MIFYTSDKCPGGTAVLYATKPPPSLTTKPPSPLVLGPEVPRPAGKWPPRATDLSDPKPAGGYRLVLIHQQRLHICICLKHHHVCPTYLASVCPGEICIVCPETCFLVSKLPRPIDQITPTFTLGHQTPDT